MRRFLPWVLAFVASACVEVAGGPDPTPEPEPTPAWAEPSVVIHELIRRREQSRADWVELHNPTDADVALEGWSLEEADGPDVHVFGTDVIPAGGFLWGASGSGADFEYPFFLGADDVLTLRNAEGETVDRHAWQGYRAGWIYGRPDDAGPIVRLEFPTQGGPNAPACEDEVGERESFVPSFGEPRVVGEPARGPLQTGWARTLHAGGTSALLNLHVNGGRLSRLGPDAETLEPFQPVAVLERPRQHQAADGRVHGVVVIAATASSTAPPAGGPEEQRTSRIGARLDRIAGASSRSGEAIGRSREPPLRRDRLTSRRPDRITTPGDHFAPVSTKRAPAPDQR